MNSNSEEESSEAAWEVQTATSVGFPSVSTAAPSQSVGPASVASKPPSTGRKLEEESDSETNKMDTEVAKAKQRKTKQKKKRKSPKPASTHGSPPINNDNKDEKLPAIEKEEPTRQAVPPPHAAAVKSKVDESKPKSAGTDLSQNSASHYALKKEVEYSSNHPTSTPGISMIRNTKDQASKPAANPGAEYVKGSDRLQLAPGRELSTADVDEASRGDSQPGAEHVFPSGHPGNPGRSWHSQVPATNETSRSGDVPNAHVVDEAQLVDDTEIQQLREQVEQVENAPIAEVVKPGDNEERRNMKFLGLVIAAALIFILAAAGIAIAVASSKSSNPEPLKPSLQRILRRGYVKCRGQALEHEQESGLSVDMCSAIAAGVLGDPTKYEMVLMPFSDQFSKLADGTIDISTARTTATVERDVLVSSILEGVSFSTAYVYGGASYYGVPEYVGCADRGDTLMGNCRELTVCVAKATVWADMVENLLGGTNTHEVSFNSELLPALLDGTCNVITSSPITIHEQLAEQPGDTLEKAKAYVMAPRAFARDPLCLTTRNDDVEFSDMVNWIMHALIVAETMDITQDKADLFPTTDLFGEEYAQIFQNAIAAGGNYAELYARSLQAELPRGADGINTPHLHSDDGGLLYPIPLGKVDRAEIPDTAGPVPQGTLESIEQRQNFTCGILQGRPGLAEWNATAGNWTGIDVDFCRGIAAALFAGKFEAKLVLIAYKSMEDGFIALAAGELDALSGAVYNMVNDIREPTTGQGFAFSDIYYYQQEDVDGDVESVKTLAMVTREEDVQWTDFVRSLVSSTIHAEAFGIKQDMAVEMPLFQLLGSDSDYLQAFRDVILAVGNYAEIYERNMEVHIPRATNTRNTLNQGDTPMFFANWKF